MIDSTLSIRTAAGKRQPGPRINNLYDLFIDWNVVLRYVNQFIDEVSSCVQEKSRSQQLAEWARLGLELDECRFRAKDEQLRQRALTDASLRTDLIVDIVLSYLAADMEAPINSYWRSVCRNELTRLAAALAVYRAEQGEYPETLEQLVPAVIPKLPVDLYSGKSFLYERKDDGGYLLYSVFENEIDDLGTGMDGLVIKGEWVDEQPEDFDYQESDLIIRVPVPPFKFPEPPSKEDFEGGYGGYGGEYGGGEFGE